MAIKRLECCIQGPEKRKNCREVTGDFSRECSRRASRKQKNRREPHASRGNIRAPGEQKNCREVNRSAARPPGDTPGGTLPCGRVGPAEPSRARPVAAWLLRPVQLR